MIRDFKAGYPSKVNFRMFLGNKLLQNRMMPNLASEYEDDESVPDDRVIEVYFIKEKAMNVAELIDELKKIEDQTLPTQLGVGYNLAPIGCIRICDGNVRPMSDREMYPVKMTKAEYRQLVSDKYALEYIYDSKAIQRIEKTVNWLTSWENEHELPMTTYVVSKSFVCNKVSLTQQTIDAIKQFVQEAMDDGPDTNKLKVTIDDMIIAYGKGYCINMVFKITISEK